MPEGGEPQEGALSPKHILFVSGSIGLGHVTRDLAIAREVRTMIPVNVTWLAGAPADGVIREAGETLHPGSAHLVDMSAIAEAQTNGGRLSLIKYALRARRTWGRNFDVVDEIMAHGDFDLLVGDETYEIALGYRKKPARKKRPFIMIYDFVGFDAMSKHPLEKLGVYLWNRTWVGRGRGARTYADLGLFIGEEEDVPDVSFGPFLPSRRDWARTRCEFVGYVLDFAPPRYSDPVALRRELGYDLSPLVICAVGGTSIGRELLDLCGSAYPLLRQSIPDLQMVLVCGPRLDPRQLRVPQGVKVKGYVPALYKHLAACDLAVVQGGGTVTLELTALRRPFVFFPIEGHCEQEVHVAERLSRHQAGVRLRQSVTSPARLAEVILTNLGRSVHWPHIPVDGARLAAEAICRLLRDGSQCRAAS
jgi:UDP:flavonoid glycosyltransferase YjiC (YdhE family)